METTLLLATMPAHFGVPLTDFVAWAVVIAFLASPVANDTARTAAQRIVEIGGAMPRSAAAGHQSAEARAIAPSAPVAVVPAAQRLSPAAQWQTVSRLVSGGADRAIAVARDQQAIRRELDALDLTLENLRRELSTVMSIAIPTVPRGAELVALPVRARLGTLAA